MRDGRVVPSSGGGWDWGNLRNFNTLLEYSVNCDDANVRTQYDALARFFRAYFYFEKVKNFGDVPWYDRQIDSDEDYLEQSAAAASELIEHSGYYLYTEGGKDVCYRNLFSSHRAQECEVILARNLNAEYKVYCDVGQYLTNKTYGRPGVTKKIINSYLMKDGTRFTDKPGYDKMSFMEECKNRDPRLAQSIRTPGVQTYRLNQTSSSRSRHQHYWIPTDQIPRYGSTRCRWNQR